MPSGLSASTTMFGGGGGMPNPSPTVTRPTPTGNQPPGYEWDSVQGRYVPSTQSATYAASQAQRRTSIQDIGNSQEQTLFNRLTNALDGLQRSSSTTSSGNGTGMAATPSTVQYPTVQMGDASGAAQSAQAAAFGAAKAKAGAMGRSAVDSLRAELADRGILGGGTEGRGLTDRLAAATNPLSDINVAGLHENVGIAEHNQDASQRAAETGFQGAITQRGQDIGANEAAAQLAQQRALQNQQMLSQMLSGLTAKLNIGLSY